MLFAGLSEFLIIAAIAFAISQRHRNQTRLVFISYLLCGLIVAATSLLGALKFLGIADLPLAYFRLGFASLFFAMTGFIVTGLWPFLISRRKKQLGAGLIIIALCSAAINGFTPIKALGSISIILSAMAAIWILKEARPLAITAFCLLLSTLVWGAVLSDDNLRIGFFHMAIAGFFSCLALAIKHSANHPCPDFPPKSTR